jgi:hypothetical protein
MGGCSNRAGVPRRCDRAARDGYVIHGESGALASAGRGPGLSGSYGVIAMAEGLLPTLIALRAVLVAVRIGVTVPEPLLTT